MIKPKVAGEFNAATYQNLDSVRWLAEQSPADAKALVDNLKQLYEQGQRAYGWSDSFANDSRAIVANGQVAPAAEVREGRPAFHVYETIDLAMGNNTKPVYVSGQLTLRNDFLFLQMDGGRQLPLAASERGPKNPVAELRPDFVSGFLSPDEKAPVRVRLKGTIGSDGRFKVELGAPDRPEYRHGFEHGRLYFNRQLNWLELQTPRGNVVIRNERLKAELMAAAAASDRPSLGLILPGEAKAGERGGLVYDDYPQEYGVLTGFSRNGPNQQAGTAANRTSLMNFGFSSLRDVPVTYPAEQEGRVWRNTDRRGGGRFGPDAVNGRLWAFGHFTNDGRLGFAAREISEQCDRYELSAGAGDAPNSEAVRVLAEAHQHPDDSGPLFSARNDG